jgi:hypothetical protein
LYGWIRFFIDVFSTDPKPKTIVRPSKTAPDNMRRGDIKNDGRKELENVSVYDSSITVYAKEAVIQGRVLTWAGDDNPEDELPWWTKLCIVCVANAQEEGEKPPTPPRWWPPRGRPGGIAIPGGKNKPIEYRPPTAGQRRAWEDLLKREGREKLEKSKMTIQKTLEVEYRKLAEIYKKGGYPNPVERTILREQNNLEIINDLLSK